MGQYDITVGTQNWDVPLNANLDNIDGRLTNGEAKNSQQDGQIATLQSQTTTLNNNISYQVFNVKSPLYGALGDGAHDDTVAIQNAINAANAAGGGVVYLPAGQYKISAALTLYNRITVRGDGDYVTNIIQTSTTANGFVGSSLIYIIIEHLRLTGPGTGSGQGIKFTTEFDYCILRDISTTAWGSTGIELEQPIVTNLTRVTSFSNGGAGIYIHGNISTGAGTSVSLDSCWVHDNVSNGYSIQNMTYCSFQACASDNQINTGTAGYLFVGCTAFTLSGCGSEGNYVGWQIDSASTGFVLNSPYIYNTPSGGSGIWVTGGSTNVQILGSTEAAPQVGASAAIKVDTGCSATIQGAVATTANSLASGTTVLASNASGVRSYPNGVTTPTLTMTGNIAMGSNKVTGLANGTAVTDAVNFRQIPVNKVCTSNETNSTTTQQASTQLVFPVEANTTYVVSGKLIINSPSGINFLNGFTAPTGSTLVWGESTTSPPLTLAQTDTWSGTGVDKWANLWGTLTVGSTAGNLTATFASGTAANTATLKSGSQVTIQKV